MNKLGTALGCMLMIGALSAPVAFAHYDANGGGLADAAGVSGNPDSGNNADRVSGSYVGSAGALLVVQNVPDLSAACVNVPPGDARDLCVALLSGGDFPLGAVDALCDAEVNFPGGGPNDEEFVDGQDSALLDGLDDDLFNDGGSGAVCHTEEGFYDGAEPADVDYDTGGCNQYTGAANAAHGRDLASPVLWGSPSCDFESPGSSGSLVDHLVALALCAVNEVLSADLPADVLDLDLVNAEVGCVVDFVECVAAALPSPELDAVRGLLGAANCPSGASSCGADSAADVSNFGNLDSAAGVQFPAAGVDALNNACNNVAAASVFLWNAVVVDAEPDCSDGVDNESPGDGDVDAPADAECENALDDDESQPGFQAPVHPSFVSVAYVE